MIPSSDLPGETSPGQFGPMIRIPGVVATTLSISCTGMPSVMQTASPIPASCASYSASAANAGGTNTIECVAPVAPTASATVLNTGTRPSTVEPPLPGVTPATICVPYASIRWVWNNPSRPVTPCTTTREFLSRKMDTVSPYGSACGLLLLPGATGYVAGSRP